MKKIALLFFLFLGTITVRAQVEIQKPANVRLDGSIFSLIVVRGAPPVTLDFVYTGGTPGEPVEWKITPVACYSAPLNPCVNPELKGGTVNQFIVNTSKSYSLLCKVTVNAGDPDVGPVQTDEKQLLITVRNPVDYSLILDKSGSMSTIMANPNISRMDALKKGVGIMATKLAEFGTEYDSIGIRYFDYDSVMPANAALKGSLIPVTSGNLGIIQSDVNSAVASGNTALGNGMRAGRNQLLNAPAVKGHTKVMFVFSDGEQNSGNLVNPNKPRFLTTGDFDLRGNYPTTDSISTYTVCLGVVGDYPHLMAAIADSNPNRYLILENFDPQFPAKIEAGLDAMVNKILKGNSPQFVGIRNKDYNTDLTFKEQFIVNKGVHKVFITMVSQPAGADTVLSLTVNGTNVLPYAVKHYGNGYRTFTINFPITESTSWNLNPDGVWEISGKVAGYATGGYPPVSTHIPDNQLAKPHYYMSFTVDDHQVKLDYSLGGKTFTTGQTLHPSVKLTRNGAVVRNATIKAGIFAPGVDFGDFIARAGGTYSAPPTGDPGSPGLQKLEELMRDSANAEKFKARENEITLTYDPATETYKGDFNGLNVSGVYQVLYSVMAQDSVDGDIQRFEQNSVMVTHNGVDLAQSGMSVVLINGQTVITFRPATSNGTFWGPGWAAALNVNFPGAVIDSITDIGDGTYKVFVKGELKGSGSISIGGINAFSGDVSALSCYSNQSNWWGKLICWLLSIGLPAWSVWVIVFILLLILWLIFKKKK